MAELSLIQLIADAGGVGGVSALGVNLLKTWSASERQRKQDELNNRVRVAEVENPNILNKLKMQPPSLADWVVRFIVVCAMFVWTSPVWGPLLNLLTEASIGVVWYWPTDLRFFLFDFNKLKELSFGPESPEVIIGILPSHLAGANNIIGFYFINRVFKRQ